MKVAISIGTKRPEVAQVRTVPASIQFGSRVPDATSRATGTFGVPDLWVPEVFFWFLFAGLLSILVVHEHSTTW